jgi:hypothetical protein
MALSEQEKIDAIISVLRVPKLTNEQKTSFAKALISEMPKKIEFAENYPAMSKWVNALAEPSLEAAEALQRFCELYYAHSSNDWVKSAIVSSDKALGGSSFIEVQNSFIKLARALNKKKEAGPT